MGGPDIDFEQAHYFQSETQGGGLATQTVGPSLNVYKSKEV